MCLVVVLRYVMEVATMAVVQMIAPPSTRLKVRGLGTRVWFGDVVDGCVRCIDCMLTPAWPGAVAGAPDFLQTRP